MRSSGHRILEHADSVMIIAIGHRNGPDLECSFCFSGGDMAPSIGICEDIILNQIRYAPIAQDAIEEPITQACLEISKEWKHTLVIATRTLENNDTGYWIRNHGNVFAIRTGIRAVFRKIMGNDSEESWKE
jgi:hypothetical protein